MIWISAPQITHIKKSCSPPEVSLTKQRRS